MTAHAGQAARVTAAAVAAALLAAAVPSALSQPHEVSVLAPVVWLAGCWAADGQDPGSVEHWLAPAGGTMFGVSRSVAGGKTVAFEFMQLRAGDGGRLTLIAAPSGQRETHFVLAAHAADSVTFENPQHDFPQRVIYRQLPGGRLVGRIEGQRGGTFRGIDFPMRRVPCEPAPAAAR